MFTRYCLLGKEISVGKHLIDSSRTSTQTTTEDISTTADDVSTAQ